MQNVSDKHYAALAFTWNIVPIEAKVAGNKHKSSIRSPASYMDESSLAWKYPVGLPKLKLPRTHDKVLGQPETAIVETRFCIPLPHTTLLLSIAVGGRRSRGRGDTRIHS